MSVLTEGGFVCIAISELQGVIIFFQKVALK